MDKKKLEISWRCCQTFPALFQLLKNILKKCYWIYVQKGQVEKPCFGHGRTSERCYRNF